jgi:flagellar hook-associated protein 2
MAIASSSAVLDVPSLVSQLMAVERQPIDKLNTKVSSYQTKISSFGTLSGLVSSFQTAVQGLTGALQAYGATASDAGVFSATASSTATAGTYSVSVAHLAQAQTLVATGQTSATTAITAAASTVTFNVGGTSTDVAIAAGATLEDIRTTINSANLGVTATIVNDGSGAPYRLALSSTHSGLSNAVSSITIKTGGDGSLNSLLAYNPSENAPASTTLTQVVAPLDASLTVNGIAITSASNTVTDAIQGVTLTLKNVTTTPAALTVARDTSAINKAVSSFVDTYNALTSQLRSRSAYGTSTTAAPALAGDGTVRQMLDQLRGIFTSPASGGTLSYLSQVGITTQADGSLKLDSSKLSSAMTSNFSDVTNLFTSATGFATRLDTWATSVVQTGGSIDLRTKSLNTSIKGYNDQITKLEVRMTALQKQYTTTYSNLNMLLANMNATSTYLTQQFSTKTSS